MDQNGSPTGTPGTGGTGDEAAACSRFVFVAGPGVAEGRVIAGIDPADGGAGAAGAAGAVCVGAEARGVSGVEGGKVSGAEARDDSGAERGRVSGLADRGRFRDGFSGSVVLQNVESLTDEQTGDGLVRVDQLIRWAQAQQAKLLARLHDLYQGEAFGVTGKLDPGLAFSLAAEEAAAILGVPFGTGKALMSQAGDLCTRNTATLKALESGQISYGHVETVVEQCVGVVPAELPGFEAELLGLAAGQTKAQFRVKAQRLREKHYPETIVERQRTAFDRRGVWVRPEPDGMSWFSALLPAPTAQGIFTQLSVAARGEQAAGDTRTIDQLRTDILTDLLGGHGHECGDECDSGAGKSAKGASGPGGTGAGGSGTGASDAGSAGNGGSDAGFGGKQGRGRGRGRGKGSKTGKAASSHGEGSHPASGSGSGKDAGSCRIIHGARARTEILVVINAETLFGADDRPAELNGYGPLSPVTARRMAREAAKWTPVERDPKTEEILRVGKRRKVPDGLKRVLRVRDGTCRFPGCRTNAVISEIDHTKPWAQGGPTDHDNLEHLCRRHHMFKTKGFWKARQPSPGVIEWTSPGGRTYRTEPDLTLAPDPCAENAGELRPDFEAAHHGAARDKAAGAQADGEANAADVDPSPPNAFGAASDAGHPGDLDGYGDSPPPF